MRIRLPASRRPIRWLSRCPLPRPSRRRRLPPPNSKRRQREALFQPEVDDGGCGRPYGFGGAASGEGEQPDATPEVADDTPVRE